MIDEIVNALIAADGKLTEHILSSDELQKIVGKQ